MKTQKASSIMAGVAEISIGKRTLTFKFIDDKRNEEKKIVGEKFSVSIAVSVVFDSLFIFVII